MSVKKKLLMVLLCCVVTVTATGCGLGDKISDSLTSMINKHTANGVNSKCNDILTTGCNADTEAQVVLLQEATDKLTNQDSGLQFWRWGEDNYCPPLSFFEKKQNEKLSKAVDNETVALDCALAKDEAYQKNKSVKTGKVVKVVLIVALALVLLLLLFKLLKKRRRPKAAPAPVAPAAPAAANHTGLLNTGDTARKNLQDLCSANGIDYNRAVAKFGDDEKGLTKAYMKLSAKVNAGDMEGVEELLS